MLKTTQQSPFRTELRHLMHELAGAFLFGMPFLYTMEIWSVISMRYFQAILTPMVDQVATAPCTDPIQE